MNLILAFIRFTIYTILILFTAYKFADARSYMFLGVAPLILIMALIFQTGLKRRSTAPSAAVLLHLKSIMAASITAGAIIYLTLWFYQTHPSRNQTASGRWPSQPRRQAKPHNLPACSRP